MPEDGLVNVYYNTTFERFMYSGTGIGSALDLNEQFLKALDLLDNTTQSVFLTGKAGTGKSTLLRYFRNTTRKQIVVLAPTGVAALNVQGQTIHSFFHFGADVTVEKVWNHPPSGRSIFDHLDMVIIDEASMVRADLLDCVSTMLKKELGSSDPFGGVQMVFIGDLYQLPPVVTREETKIFNSKYYPTPYFFSAKALRDYPMEVVKLKKIYRQTDKPFIKLLNKVRRGSIDEENLAVLNSRVADNISFEEGEMFVILTSTRDVAAATNKYFLDKLPGEITTLTGLTTGEFGRDVLPTPIQLQVKPGAQVMMLNNDAEGRWVNGTLGKLISINNPMTSPMYAVVELDNGLPVEVGRYKWETYEFYLRDEIVHSSKWSGIGVDEEEEIEQVIDTRATGSYTQFPFILAWAVTIHKSQGKTFDRVIIDVGKRGAFAHGQVYVALSRCRTFEGITLRRPIQSEHIKVDPEIRTFMKGNNRA